MTTRFSLSAILLAVASFAVAHSNLSGAEVIAFWDFNNGFMVEDEVPQIVHTATVGNGTLFQQRADTDGNGKGGIAFSSPEVSSVIEPLIGERSMAWDDISRSGDNDAEFFIATSTLGFKDIQIRFDVEGNGDGGFAEYDLVFALDPLVDVTNPGDVNGTIKDFDLNGNVDIFNNQPIATTVDFSPVSIDLSGITALNNQSVLSIRFDDFEGNDTVSFDNILITGTAVPEPGSALTLVAMTGLACLRRRKRS